MDREESELLIQFEKLKLYANKKKEELLMLYARGERDFLEFYLDNTDLSGVNLSYANFYNASFNYTNLINKEPSSIL